ncbi:alpha/beta fold hydrolase [Nocardioides jejuensis]|uniref:Alpha/beta fold hydrolase n=2 Tax=Nocardioides jejuensis TaxID=2502782 RepID=A0A4R1CBB0_9ACTN|nr:alpha/beta fold hydrolase [Nocardioides jejuensis]
MGIGSRYYKPLVAAFEEIGWDAIALTRRGFEDKTVTASRRLDWSYMDEIDDIHDAVAEARTTYPGRPVLLLGHSLGGQLTAGFMMTGGAVDGVITVGGAIPHYRLFPYAGVHLALMGAVIVPALTATFGYLPKPAFGGPGARTLMREWASMALTGRTPFPEGKPISVPSLVVSLDNDSLAPYKAVEAFGKNMFDRDALTRWHYTDAEVPVGATNDHVAWVRTPETVVSKIHLWWDAETGQSSGF